MQRKKQQSLQELIDSYNAEIMRYSQMAQPEHTTAAGQRTEGEKQRESGEEEIERGRTERDYWLGKGKQGLQSGSPSAARDRRPEPDEPLYRPGSNMPRPEPSEPLEPPKASILPAPPAGTPDYDLWRREVENSLAELQRVISELQRSQQDIIAGHRNSSSAPQQSHNFVPNPAVSPQKEASTPPNAHTPPQSEQKHTPTLPPLHIRRNTPENSANILHSTPVNAHSPASSAPLTPQNTHQNGISAPFMQNQPQNRGIIFSPQSEQAPSSNAGAPISPISSDQRSAQSSESIPADGTGTGYLQVGVYTARQSNPIPNARVTIFRTAPEGSELYASATTDDDGRIPLIQLPAGTSSTDTVSAPFSIYNVSVAADGYYPRSELQAQIFDGITAQLWVELTPLPDSAWS